MRHLIAAIIVMFGLACLVLGNTEELKNLRFLGGSIGNLISDLGFAALVIAAFQWVFDNRFREVFFSDIRNEVGAAEAVRDAGIVDVCADSRNADYGELVARASLVEIGVAFSDRLIKDYLQTLKGRHDLTLRVFFADTSDVELVRALGYMVRNPIDHVTRSAAILQEFLNDIEVSGVTVQRIPVRSVSHYSFIRFDGLETFLVLSTYSSRRASVPTLQIAAHSVLWRLVEDDIQAAKEAVQCQASSDESSTPWLKNLGRMLSTKRSRRGGRDRKPPP